MKKSFPFIIYIFFLFFTSNLLSEDNKNNSHFEIMDPDKLYSLYGDWKLSHKKEEQFRLREFDDSKWESFLVPSIWMNRNRVEVFGWYRVHLYISDSLRDVDLGFISSNILEASEIYFNGVMIGKLGVIDNNGKLIKSNPKYDYFQVDKKLIHYNADNVIAIKLANFYGGMGGMQHTSYFGNLELCKKEFNQHLIFYPSFAFGMIGLGIYHLVIFLKFRKDKTYLYYSGIVFSIALFVITVFKFNYWFIESFYIQFILFSSSIAFGALSVYLFVSSFFEYQLTKTVKIIIIFYLGFIVLEVIPIFFPSLFLLRNKYLIKMNILANVLFVVFSCALLVKAFIAKKNGWNVIAVGTIISVPLFIWDVLRALDIFPQKNWFIIENCLVITITFAVALSKKYSVEYEKLLEVEKEYAKDLTLEVKDKTDNLLRTNEELKKANELKNKLFSTISQSLRNPLEMLDEVIHLFNNKKYTRADLKKYFVNLNENLRRNRFLLENLLNWSYSQLENKGNVILTRLDLIPILEDSILFFQADAKSKSIEILSYLNSSAYVYANQNMLRLIFINLLSNAIKFTPRNGTILIELKSQKPYISVEIADSGIGISKDVLESIQIKNELVSTLGTEKEKGTGLGLKITKDFIDKVGGIFLLETETNFGTRVKVKLKTNYNGKN
ncbi:MAG: sensor histidine kinase [Leptospiraceae bacterium]|nr:sensor histidine kinase [Leptospiraceae bacterium]